ncbi:MAG TPA: hypothetical protein VH599_15665 [Ktedonobacterales bacterium]|jgi:hypothetical protein
MMTLHTLSDELNLLADAAPSENLLRVGQNADDQPEEPDEPDDGVEALIVHLDRTTAEHVFLQAQRQIQREAARVLVDEHP